jgi:hypothetical protein
MPLAEGSAGRPRRRDSRWLWRALLCVTAFHLAAPASLAYKNEIKAVAQELRNQLTESGKSVAAVVDFTDLDYRVPRLGQFLAEQLTVHLASGTPRINVIERARLRELLKEHELAASGVIDPNTASMLGKIHGVQAIITGVLTPSSDTVNLMTKAIDTTTATILGIAEIDIPRTQHITDLLNQGTMTPSGATEGKGMQVPQGAGPKTTAAADRQPASAPAFTTDAYQIVVEETSASAGSVTVVITMRSISDRIVEALFRDAYVLDESGVRYNWSEGGNECCPRYRTELLPGTRVRAKWVFRAPEAGVGSAFTLAATEEMPMDGRRVQIKALKATN